MKNFFSLLGSAPKLISNILKYLPVILVAFKALEMVQVELEKVNTDVAES